MPSQLQMYIYYTGIVIIAYLIGVGSILESDHTIYVVIFTSIPFVVSIFGMFIVRKHVERLDTKEMFSLRTQSWAFVLGDSVALPIAFFFLAQSHRSRETNSFFESNGWTILALLAGVAVGCIFRKIDAPRYFKAKRATALKTPTKVWHDLVVYPVLTGLVVWTSAPLLWSSMSYTKYGIVGGLVLWLCLCLRDIRHPPDVRTQHSTWNVHTFRPS